MMRPVRRPVSARSLRSGNYPETTRYNYPLASAQLARYPGV
jgi:integrase/recombinase XerC